MAAVLRITECGLVHALHLISGFDLFSLSSVSLSSSLSPTQPFLYCSDRLGQLPCWFQYTQLTNQPSRQQLRRNTIPISTPHRSPSLQNGFSKSHPAPDYTTYQPPSRSSNHKPRRRPNNHHQHHERRAAATNPNPVDLTARLRQIAASARRTPDPHAPGLSRRQRIPRAGTTATPRLRLPLHVEHPTGRGAPDDGGLRGGEIGRAHV